MNDDNIRHVLSRLALAVVFVGIGIWEIVQPSYWSAFVPSFITILDPNALVIIHGAIMLAIGIGIGLGVYLRLSAVLASLMMVSIIVMLLMESGFTDLIIRDAGVLLIAMSLIFDDTDYLRLRK